MDCRDVRPLISAYMDNELTPVQLRVMQSHVEGCADCAATLESYRRVRTVIRALPQPVPPSGLREAVFAKATPAYRRRAFFFDLGQRGLAAGALAVMLAAVLFTASLFVNRPQPAEDLDFGSADVQPRIVEVRPGHDFRGWTPSEPVRVTFNQAMRHETVEAALSIMIEPATPDASSTPAEDEAVLLETLQWENKGRTLVIGGQHRLKPDTRYTVAIDTSIARDHHHHPLLPEGTQFAFQTAQLVTTAEKATATAAATATQGMQATPTALPTPVPPMAAATLIPTPTADASPTAVVAAPDGQETPTASLGPSEPTATVPASLPPSPPPTATASTPAAQPARTATQPAPTIPAVPPTSLPAPPSEPPAPTPTPTVVVEPTPPPDPRPGTPTPSPTPAAPTTPTVLPVPTTPTASPVPTATATPTLPYDVVRGFGLLYQNTPTVRQRLGLPTANEARVQGTTQRFERGLMYWRGDTRTIYVLFFEQPGIWYSFADNWVEGMDIGGGPGPAAGQFYPTRRFGKVWREHDDVQRRLGYAVTADEQPIAIVLQPFERGLMLWSEGREGAIISVLYRDNTYERHEDKFRP